MADENAKELHKRAARLFGKKELLHAFWQECAYNFYVERADFTVHRMWGEEMAAHLFDSAPLLNRRDLGNAFSSMLRPRGQPWFRATVGDERLMAQPNVAAWLDWMTARQRALMYATPSFEAATKEADHDFAAFGNAVLTPELSRDRAGRAHLLFRCWHLRDCAWVEDADRTIDTMFRKDKISARNIKQKFPDATLSDDINAALDQDPDKEFEIGHVMMPADEYSYYKKPAAKGEFASIYYDCASETILRERPSQDFRYVVPRWQTISRSPYACSPAAMCSLSDARGLQVMARVLLEAGEKQIDPPMKATEKAIRGEVNLFAGGITWVDREYDEKMGPALEPILLAKNTGLGIEFLERVAAKMKDAWYLTKLTLPSQAKTAYETAQIVEEFIRANIPLFEPMEATYNAPLLEATARILLRTGAFGDPSAMPPELRGSEIEYDFSNPLQDAIERNKVNQATTALGLLAGAVKLDPDAARGVDVGVMSCDAIRGSGAPAIWLRDPRQVAAEIAQARQQQAGQQQAGNVVQALQMAGQAADVVHQGTQAAAQLQDVTQPSVDQQIAYGPT